MKNQSSKFESIIPEIDKNRNYWFVRTDSGQNFDSYLEGKYIGIGWNNITLADIKSRSHSGDNLKLKIAKDQKLDITLSKGKGTVTAIANKLIRFSEGLKKGDLIIMPSYGSSRIAFGEIKNSSVYIENIPKDDCTYYKRKAVNWMEVKNLNELDPIFYSIIQSRHAISKIDKYASYLDKNVRTIYKKGDAAHFIIDVNSRKDIPIFTLFNTWTDLIKLSAEFAEKEGLEYDTDSITAKINVQSPGDVEIIVNSVQTIALTAMVFGAVCGIDFSIDSQYVKAKFKMPRLWERISAFLNNKTKREAVKKLANNLKALDTNSKDVIESMKEL